MLNIIVNLNRLRILEAARKEIEVINRLKFNHKVEAFLLTTLRISIENFKENPELPDDEDISKAVDIIHLAILKSFDPYTCFFYFTLTGRHKILKPIPHVEGDELVYSYNEGLKLFEFISQKESRKYIYKLIGICQQSRWQQ